MNTTLKLGMAATAMALLAACSGGKIYNLQFAQNYQHLELMAEHGGKDMKLEVLGNPYGTDPEALVRDVGAAMTGRNIGLPITFTASPTDPTDARSKVVVVFSPPITALGRQVCAGETASSENGSPSSAIISYCKDGAELSSVWVDLPSDSVAGNEPFNAALALATRELLPLRPPFDTNEKCDNDC